jgi:hypothetical protein
LVNLKTTPLLVVEKEEKLGFEEKRVADFGDS